MLNPDGTINFKFILIINKPGGLFLELRLDNPIFVTILDECEVCNGLFDKVIT